MDRQVLAFRSMNIISIILEAAVATTAVLAARECTGLVAAGLQTKNIENNPMQSKPVTTHKVLKYL